VSFTEAGNQLLWWARLAVNSRMRSSFDRDRKLEGSAALALAIPQIPSVASAADGCGLFDSFVGTTGLSDFPCPCIAGGWSMTFPARPAAFWAVGGHGISRFSRIELPHVLEVCDRAGPLERSPFRARMFCLPLATTASAPCSHLVSRLDTPPVCSPVNASPLSLPGIGA
jgi:hypothetical protein